MAKIVARNAALYLYDASGVCRSVSGLTSSITLSLSSEATDVTGFGNTTRERVADGIKDYELSMDGFYSATACETGSMLQLIHDNGGATFFKLGPAGSASGSPMYSGCVTLTSYEIMDVAEDAAKISFSMTNRSGSLTRAATFA